MLIRIQPEPFDLAALLKDFGAGAGAVVTFSGLVRDDTGTMLALELEHYPGMTEKSVTDIAARFSGSSEMNDSARLEPLLRVMDAPLSAIGLTTFAAPPAPADV